MSKHYTNSVKQDVKRGPKKNGQYRRDKKHVVYARKEKENDIQGSQSNDPSWYTSGMIAQSSSNLFFTKRFGDVVRDILPPGHESTLGWSTLSQPVAVPGIMALHTVTSFGEFTNNENSPLNVAAQAIYSWVRYANSGSRNYDSPDLMTYILSLTELYAFIVYCQRIYGFMNAYYPQNAYFAKKLITAMGANFDDLVGNNAQFCFFINSLIAKATAFAIPSDFTYIQRKVFMYQNVFIESDNIKDQMYMFVPQGFYQYTVDSTYPEGYLKYVGMWNSVNPLTVSQLMTYGTNLVNALLNNEDAGIMSGDIIKAYGADHLIKLAEMPLTYMLTPVVGDEYVMYQIRNASIVPFYNYPDLHQDTTKLYLEFHPECSVTASAWTTNADASTLWLNNSDKLLTSNKISPTADDVMESTRLMVQFKQFNITGGKAVAELITGSEIVVSMECWTISYDPYNNITTMFSVESKSNYITMPGTNKGRMLATIDAFRYHPAFIILSDYPNLSTCTYQGFMQECESITTVDRDELRNIHQAAWLNMLATPAIAKFHS